MIRILLTQDKTRQDKTERNRGQNRVQNKTKQGKTKQVKTKDKTRQNRRQKMADNKAKKDRRLNKIEEKTRVMTRQRTKQGREYFLTLPQNVLLCQDKTKLEK